MLDKKEKQLAKDKTEQFMRDYLSLPWDKGCALIRSHVFLLEMSNAELRKELAESKALPQRLMNELSHQAESSELDQGPLRFAKEKAAADGILEIHRVHIHAAEQYGGDR